MARPAGSVVALALGLLLSPMGGEAQPPGKIPRIGYLALVSPSGIQPYIGGFRQGLKELGYVEGVNISIEFRSAEGRVEQLPGLAAELVRLKVNIIIAPNTPTALAAQKATVTIPIVTVIVPDPVGLGLAQSLARPGGNVTGLSSVAFEVSAKQLEILKETVPKAVRIAILWNPSNPVASLAVREAEGAARSLGVKLHILQARGPDELDAAFGAMAREGVGALLVVPDPVLIAHRIRLAELAAKAGLPAMYGIREHVEAGGLMAYAADFVDLHRRAAIYVDRVLRGARPALLPIEQASRFELVVNLKTARALGLTIPDSVMIRAVHVIQ